MKHIISFLYLFVFTCIIMSCSTYIVDNHSYGTQIKTTTNHENFSDQDLATTSWDHLFHGTMTQVNGNGNSMKVRITSLSDSFSEEPLFIVDHTNVGKGFISVSHIDPNLIERLTVLNRPNEISIYGNQGRHGVILIKTI